MQDKELAAKIRHIKSWLGTGSINLFGLPFSGKDTHGRELAKMFGSELIGGGDIIRSSGITKHIEHINTGALTPTEDYLNLVLPYFERQEFKDKSFILSSVGRWQGEEKVILNAAAESGHQLKAVIFLDINEAEMRRRWLLAQKLKDRGDRLDDTGFVFDKRLEEFRKKTLPVIDFYRKENLLITINGLAQKPEVSQGIIDQLFLYATSSKK